MRLRVFTDKTVSASAGDMPAPLATTTRSVMLMMSPGECESESTTQRQPKLFAVAKTCPFVLL